MNGHRRWSIKHQGTLLLASLMILCVMGATLHAAILPLTITATSKSKVYGTPIVFVTLNNPASPDYTVTGLLPGDTVDSITLTSAGAPAAAPLSGSPYSIVPSAAVMTITSPNSYTISYVNASLTVTPTLPTANPTDPASPGGLLPIYRMPILLPQSQASVAWTNVAPNALADYFTYVPFKNADAVALGFPSSCGNPVAIGATAADLASTEDCYTITVKKLQQGLSLPSAWGFAGSGLLDAAGIPFAPATWVYGYGSGGASWAPPYVDTSKPGVLPGVTVTGNAPTPFVDGTFLTTGLWHFPAPSIKGTKGRPVRIQWLNELPNQKPTGFDASICGTVPNDCFPYNRIVTHVHGAHVGPESDGQVHAWFTPGFTQKGPLFESTRRHGPEGTYYYPMDQEAGTIWYHDHSTGLTHNNTNMGMAGFFPISDANEKLLQTNNVLPTGIHELGFALQDRIFYQDGQLAMPDAPILNPLLSVGCTYSAPDANGDSLVTSAASACDPVFMKDPVDGHLVPYVLPTPPLPAPAAYLSTSATLEFFGNMPVVNGVTYGKYNVDNRVYRMRFIGGTDSRAWILRLKVAGSNPARYLPFWQIGAEQGLLNNPVPVESMLLMPGERLDVLVDFSGREVLDATGTTVRDINNLPIPLSLLGARIILENWAGDGPYGGEVVLPVSNPGAMDFRSADIPEVMVFDVANIAVTDTVTPPSATTSLRVNVPAVPNLTTTPPPNTTPVRTVSLVELVDTYQRIMPTIDGRGFLDYGVSETPKLNTTEQWNIINTTVDAHPMHLHQVAFQLINRETIGQTTDLPPLCATSLFTPPLCVTPASTTVAPPYQAAAVAGYLPNSIEMPLPHEIGYKDTIMCPPGKVTRVIATFDIPGVYVWHCHILSHEEHDMMRPMVVTTPATSVTLAASSLSQSATGPMTPVTLTAQAFTGIAAYPLGSGFEYNVTAAGPLHAPIVNLPQPTRALPSFNSSLGDAFNVVNVASWTPPAAAGTYVITASAKAMGIVDAGNPVITTALNYVVGNATVTIDPVSLTTTYTGTPKAVVILPTTPPGLTVNVTYNGSATAPTNAGSYTVVATISDPSNLSFGSASATLVINQAVLTVTANNLNKTVNAANPLLTYTVTGFVPGDTSVVLAGTPTLSTTALISSPIGTYPISVTAGTLTASNYSFTFVGGTLTVKAPTKPILTWATPAAVAFGSLLSGATLNATANVPGTFVYNPPAGTVLNTSSRLLTATFTPSDAVNYATATATVIQTTFAVTTSVAQIGAALPQSSVQAAYNTAITGDVIKILGTTLTGLLTVNNPLVTLVTLKGGHDSLFAPIAGSFTTIQGKVTLLKGKVIMTNIKVK